LKATHQRERTKGPEGSNVVSNSEFEINELSLIQVHSGRNNGEAEIVKFMKTVVTKYSYK